MFSYKSISRDMLRAIRACFVSRLGEPRESSGNPPLTERAVDEHQTQPAVLRTVRRVSKRPHARCMRIQCSPVIRDSERRRAPRAVPGFRGSARLLGL